MENAMRTRMKLLTVGLVLVTAAVVGCSSTTAGTAGAIQDDDELAATSSAAPAESPSPSGSSAPPALQGSVSVNNNVCDSGLAYKCGGIGQSGVGIVFYASATSFACGVGLLLKCNYLEVAPNLWGPPPAAQCKKVGSPCGGTSNDQTTSDFSSSGRGISWCTGSKAGTKISGAVLAIGSGLANTLAMLPMCSSGDAASAANEYRAGVKSDWALPSRDELSALYYYSDRAAIGGFTSNGYWTSSQSDSTDAAWYVSFSSGYAGSMVTNQSQGVRPTRAF